MKMKSFAAALLGAMISFWVMGCALSGTMASTHQVVETPDSGATTPDQEPQTTAPQTLPISAQTTIARHTIELEVARTPQQQAIGLMGRTSLPANRGMLFPFDPPQIARFWMKNTLIPLDMIFLRAGVVQQIAANVPPCTTASCPTYGTVTPIDAVVELAGGRAKQLKLKVGDRMRIQFLGAASTRPAL